MIVGIHPDKIGHESYSDKWQQFLSQRGIECREINLLSPTILDEIQDMDGIMWRYSHIPDHKQQVRMILNTIELYTGISVFPNMATRWHYDEKAAQVQLLKQLQAPTPKTWLFWDVEEALLWAKQAEYPVVFKLSVGAGSTNVLKVDNQLLASDLIQRMFHTGMFPSQKPVEETNQLRLMIHSIKQLTKRSIHGFKYIGLNKFPPLQGYLWLPEKNYAYFQAFLDNNDFDIRITVIGDRAFGFRRMNRKGDFRASGSGLIDYDPSAVDLQCVEIAFAVSRKGGFQSMAYDFLYDSDRKPVINEISYTYADQAIFNCPGHWDSQLQWHEGQMWPEEAQVIDLISYIASRASNGNAR